MSASLRLTTDAAPRYHGLDWLRAVAALTVIALHAGIAYTVEPFPGLAWPVHDAQPSPLVDALTWWIDAWIMPVFFLMGGFLAAQLFARLGPAEFLKHRARRLLVPFAFACVVILPLDLYAWLLGWVVEGRIPLQKLRSLKLGDAGRDLWGVGHLWFLEYLFVFCVGAIVVQWAWRCSCRWSARLRKSRAPTSPETGGPTSSACQAVNSGVNTQDRFPVLRTQVVPTCATRALAAAFLCSAVALWWDPRLVIGFRHAWQPLPANLLYYAPCFAVGWWLLSRRTDDRRAWWLCIAAMIASPLLIAAALPLIRTYAAEGLAGSQRWLLIALFAASGWTMALGSFRLSLISCAPPPRGVQYVAQASFWMYLFHHPVVGLAQVAVHGSPISAGQKYLLVWLSATVLSLLTYEACVRRTWVGALLNGRREQRSAVPEVIAGGDESESHSARRAA